jgi:short-subunit dehydrogenase
MDAAPLFRHSMDAATVARLGYRAMRAGRTRVITGLGNRLLAYSSKLSPDWIVRKVTQALMALPQESSAAK